jgi:hypothetical protein
MNWKWCGITTLTRFIFLRNLKVKQLTHCLENLSLLKIAWLSAIIPGVSSSLAVSVARALANILFSSYKTRLLDFQKFS